MPGIENNFSFYDDVHALERYLNLPTGSLKNIPIYARKPAVDAILKVKEMESNSIFRPGLYYIVLADLCANTAFNETYGDVEADIRVQWFQTAVIESIGQIDIRNYIAFNKTIGDAALLIFSSFHDVFAWSERLSQNLSSLSQEYATSLEQRGGLEDRPEDEVKKLLEDFQLRARRFVHLGEVSYKDQTDPLCLSVSQTFKIEKNFSDTDLGCTEPVADAIRPKLNELRVRLHDNKTVTIPGIEEPVMTYYVRK
jgi:class 3 adenylate cyclase